MPGSPILYYGDEIGMGDNFYLGDRHGVRTPMQWSPDRNAGFSKANPQSLYLPAIIEPEYHYEAINVESQEKNPDSLLWWMKRTIALRKRYKAFGRGTIQFLHPDNRKILAFIRQYQEETILVLANLSRQAQYTDIDLGVFQGRTPVEMSGGTRFPVIGEQGYPITLGAYSFYWFSLEPPEVVAVTSDEASIADTVPRLSCRDGRDDLFKSQTRPILDGVLLGYIRRSRWFGGKARQIRGMQMRDVIPISQNGMTAHIILAEVSYAEGEPEVYTLTLALVSGEQAERIVNTAPNAIIARIQFVEQSSASESLLCDAMASDSFCQIVLQAMARRRRFRGERGEIEASHTRALRRLAGQPIAPMPCKLVSAEQSNTSVVYADKLIMKLIRRPGDGINPDLEVGRFLTEKTSFLHIAPMAGALEYRPRRTASPVTLAVLQGLVPNQGDAWSYTLDAIAHYFEWALAQTEVNVPTLYTYTREQLIDLEEEVFPELVSQTIGTYLVSARLLGQRTAELHVALASNRDDPDFAPEPFTDLYRRSLYQSMRNLTNEVFRTLRRQLKNLPADAYDAGARIISLESDILTRFRSVLTHRISGMKTRVHGDYHLGQVLYTGNDFVIIDFEGEPARSLTQRRLKRSPLRDVAGMIRSFHYAANTALFGQASTVIRPQDVPQLEQWSTLWYQRVCAAFLKSYLQVATEATFLPSGKRELYALLDIYLLEKAVYEVGYELNNRPAWVRVPLQGILQLLEADGA
jgi:maltose alpha-D-glucosyltransferase/alpha-amylase